MNNIARIGELNTWNSKRRIRGAEAIKGDKELLTLHDILEAIVGDIRSLGEPVETPIVVREDGSWLIDGDTPVEKLKEVLSVTSFPGEEEGYYRTSAGLIMYILQRIPKEGDHIELKGLRYEVVDMDGNRIDKVMVTRVPTTPLD